MTSRVARALITKSTVNGPDPPIGSSIYLFLADTARAGWFFGSSVLQVGAFGLRALIRGHGFAAESDKTEQKPPDEDTLIATERPRGPANAPRDHTISSCALIGDRGGVWHHILGAGPHSAYDHCPAGRFHDSEV